MHMSIEPTRRIPYSADMRWRMVWQHLALDLTFKEIARNLNVDPSTACRINNLFLITGDVQPKMRAGMRREDIRKIDSNVELFIVGLILDEPKLYLSEVCKAVFDYSGVVVSEATICRLFRKYGITRKKIRRVALQQSAVLRGQFMADVLLYRREMFVWVDESGCDRRDTMRKYGYAIRGQTPVSKTFLVRGNRISVIAAICSEGLLAVEYYTGSVNGDVFYDYVAGTLIPQMNTFDGFSDKSIVIMDNCSIHHVQRVLQLFQSVGILVIFLPPYSPDFNPIEETFSYVKYYMKANDHLIQSLSNPLPVLKHAFNIVTCEQCNAWISHSGYN